MFIASMLYQRQDFHQVMVTSIFSAVFVLMLVASKDLGGALSVFFTYLVMVYVATRRFLYFGGGILAMIVASLLGYRLFDHVQARVQAWSNPLLQSLTGRGIRYASLCLQSVPEAGLDLVWDRDCRKKYRS